jgi:D-3-phosphoglycerate dehydrogenase
MPRVLVATVKPFAPLAVSEIKKVLDEAGYELELLEKYDGQDKLIQAVQNADALIVRSDKVDAEVIGAMEQMKVIVRAGAGYDNIDLASASEKNIVVMNTPGQNSNAVGELVVGMMVYLARNQFNGTSGTELRGKTLGLQAYGNVGKYVAEIAKGFGMKIYAYDPFIDKKAITNDGIVAVDSLEELYSTCEYVSLHIPANEKTRESINYKLLAMMPKNATLVNGARKEIINENDLLKIFEARDDFKYISDIAPDCKEEIENKYPGRYLFTPKKMGAQTAEANINAGIAAAKQIVGLIENNDKTFQVNK